MIFRRLRSVKADTHVLDRARRDLANGDFEECRAECESILARDPDNIDALELSADADIRANNGVAAIASLEHAIEVDPNRSTAWRRLAEAHGAARERAGLLDALQRWCRAIPGGLDSWSSLVKLHADAGEWESAEQIAQKCVAMNPDNGRALEMLGIVRIKRSDWLGARNVLERALALEPELASSAKQLAFAFEVMGDVSHATHWNEQAILFGEPEADLHVQAARLARRRGDPAFAIEQASLASRLEPDRADARYQLGCALWDKGDVDGASNAFHAAIERDAEDANARWAFAMAAVPGAQPENVEAVARRFAERLTSLETWLDDARAPRAIDALGTFTPFFLAYLERDNRALLTRYGDLCSRVLANRQKVAVRQAPPRDSGRRPVRLGVVSAHLSDHSVWHAIVKGWFLHLDNDVVELYAYALKPTVDDETRIAAKHAKKFVQLRSRSQHDWARAIGEDALDAIVYPEIGMNGVALQLACQRLAPLQMVAWGHPQTSGLPEIDIFLSGRAFEPEHGAAHYREQLVALANLGVCYTPPDVGSDRSTGHSDAELLALGIDPNRPVLLCPGTAFKYTPDYDETYIGIARRAPEAQMVFFDDGRSDMGRAFRARLESAFHQQAMALSRHAMTVPWLDAAEWNKLLGRTTAVLDTPGFSGFNTAARALAAGVPVVAWEGKFLRGRLASGLLRRMGLDRWVASSVDEFVATIALLCQDGHARQEALMGIERAKPSAFGDVEPVKELERLLVERLGS